MQKVLPPRKYVRAHNNSTNSNPSLGGYILDEYLPNRMLATGNSVFMKNDARYKELKRKKL